MFQPGSHSLPTIFFQLSFQRQTFGSLIRYHRSCFGSIEERSMRQGRNARMSKGMLYRVMQKTRTIESARTVSCEEFRVAIAS